MGLKDFMNKCGARLQKPGAQKKRGSVKDILEALSCYNSGAKQKAPSQMRSITHSIQTGQTGLNECCPNTGLANHTKVVLFYDLTSMGAGELADAFISSNKFFNEMQQQHGFFGDVYHIGAYGERWVTWPAWVLDRNVHTRGIEDHLNAPHTGTDALDELLAWISADGGGTLTGTVNGAVTFNGSGDPNETTVYYGTNQTSPTMPPLFTNTEELLVIGFEDEALSTPNRWIDVNSYVDNGNGYGPDGDWLCGGYYDGPTPHPTVATDGSYVATWMDVAASHTLQVDNITQLGGAAVLKTNAANLAHKPDHSGDSDNWTYDPSFWSNPNYNCLASGLTGAATNSCSGLTDGGVVGSLTDQNNWMSANHPSVDFGDYIFTNTGSPCGNSPWGGGITCCCGVGGQGCYNKLDYVRVSESGGAYLSPYLSNTNALVAWINANLPGTGVAAGDTKNEMTVKMNAVYGTSLGQPFLGVALWGGVCICSQPSAGGCQDPCVIYSPTLDTELNYTFSFPSVAGALTGSMKKYRQTTTTVPDLGTPTVMFQHDYCIAKKVINSHLGNIRYFVYSVPPASGRVKPHVVFPLSVLGPMENGPLGVAPTGSACTLTAATTAGPYDSTGFNNMKAWGAGFGYNVVDLPCSSAQFSTDIQAYLNL